MLRLINSFGAVWPAIAIVRRNAKHFRPGPSAGAVEAIIDSHASPDLATPGSPRHLETSARADRDLPPFFQKAQGFSLQGGEPPASVARRDPAMQQPSPLPRSTLTASGRTPAARPQGHMREGKDGKSGERAARSVLRRPWDIIRESPGRRRLSSASFNQTRRSTSNANSPQLKFASLSDSVDRQMSLPDTRPRDKPREPQMSPLTHSCYCFSSGR
jgi:hypothetical protein